MYHLFLLYTNFALISTFEGNVLGKIYFYKGEEKKTESNFKILSVIMRLMFSRPVCFESRPDLVL